MQKKTAASSCRNTAAKKGTDTKKERHALVITCMSGFVRKKPNVSEHPITGPTKNLLHNVRKRPVRPVNTVVLPVHFAYVQQLLDKLGRFVIGLLKYNGCKSTRSKKTAYA